LVYQNQVILANLRLFIGEHYSSLSPLPPPPSPPPTSTQSSLPSHNWLDMDDLSNEEIIGTDVIPDFFIYTSFPIVGG
jgi:hypothetical protein